MECNICLFNKITFGSVPMRLLKYILCGTLVLSATAALAQGRSFELPIRAHIFENGLRLLVIERPGETRVVAKIFTDMGALNETPGQYGSAHFLEHLMFKGTPTLGSRDWPREKELHERIQWAEDALEEELNRARNALRERGVFHDYQHHETTPRVGELRVLIESLNHQVLELNDEGPMEKWYQAYGGTGLTATTEQEYMKFDLDLPADRVELFLRVEADRMQNTVFRNFDAERMILVEQRLGDLNGNATAYHEAMNALVGRSSMVYVPEGYMNDFGEYTRRYERGLYERYFIANNTTLIFIGGVTLEDMKAKVEKYFGHMQRRPEPPRYQGREPLPTAEKRLTWRSDSLSPRVEFRYQIPGVGHPDRPQFDVLKKALEPHLQSVLSSAGVAASVDINTLVVHTTRFGVPASFNIEVTVENAVQTATAEALILDEIRELSEEALPEDDVALARKILRTEWYRTAANPSALAFEIGHFEVMDSWKTLAPYLEARDQTEAGDLTRLINKYFVAENRSVGVVVPEGAVQ
jgi:predicted Zn-dependent peptidase